MGNAAICLSLVGILVIAFLSHKGAKGAIFYGILITWILGMIAQAVGWYVPDPEAGVYSVYPNFAISGVKMDYFFAFDFEWIGAHLLDFVVIVFSFLYVDIFDTVGTLIGVAAKADLLDEDGKLPNAKQALLSDAIGTCVGAICGTSTVTSFVESSAGAAAGGKTGLTSVTTGILFLVSLILSPLFLSVPGFATTPALVYVGYLMMTQIKNVQFEGVPMSDVISAFLAIIMMPFTSSIANGIMFGIISYLVLRTLEGHAKDVKPVMWISGVLFVLYMIVG
jgi:AGZA family xanthine/uracil permease-like MFS transporter